MHVMQTSENDAYQKPPVIKAHITRTLRCIDTGGVKELWIRRPRISWWGGNTHHIAQTERLSCSGYLLDLT